MKLEFAMLLILGGNPDLPTVSNLRESQIVYQQLSNIKNCYHDNWQRKSLDEVVSVMEDYHSRAAFANTSVSTDYLRYEGVSYASNGKAVTYRYVVVKTNPGLYKVYGCTWL